MTDEEINPNETGEADASPDPVAELGPLPGDVLAAALLRTTRINELDSRHVPLELMIEPVAVSLAMLKAHKCAHPARCPHTPPPLRFLLKVRRIGNDHAGLLHDAIWRYPESTLVQDVRHELAKRHSALVEEIETGKLFEPARLGVLLADCDPTQLQGLAAALWSTGLTDERAEALFRVLPAFGHVAPPSELLPPPSPPARAAQSEKPRHRDKRLKLEARVTELEAQLTSAKNDVRERATELRKVRDRAIQLEKRLAAASDENEQANHRIAQLTKDVLDSATDLVGCKRQLTRDKRTVEQLQNELRSLQEAADKTEEEHASVVRQLASTRAQVQELETALAAVPRGKAAIADWLQREETRLAEELSIAQGGDRVRAEDDKRLRRKLEQAFREAYPEQVPQPPLALGQARRIEFVALGGGAEVGRSCYLLCLGPHRVLIDCGIAVGGQRSPSDRVPDLTGVERLHALLVTHAHTDHVGWIPALVARLSDPFPIYCTGITSQLMPIMLRDSRAHYERAMADQQRVRSYDPHADPIYEEYQQEDLYEVETRLLEARPSEPRGIAGTDLEATFLPAGHILGAASILIEGGGRRILFSGDISTEWQATVGAAMLPDDFEPVDLLVLESTYGGQVRASGEEARRQLVSFVRETVEDGVALLPSFALGRGQEVCATLIAGRQDGVLPSDLRIVVDGMIRKINRVYAEHQKLLVRELVQVETTLDREVLISEIERGGAPPTAVVTTSGMLTGGPIVVWGSRLLAARRNRMALLGYQDEASPGGALRKAGEGRPPYTVPFVGDDGQPHIVRVPSPVPDIPLSAHADEDGLVNFARQARPRTIVLVHGSDLARQALQRRLIRERIAQQVLLDEEVTLT